MLPRLLTPAILAAALVPGSALAMDQSAKSDMSGSTSMEQSAQSLPQELKQKLTDQGFSDVKVVPGSFIISAKDKEGDPVTAIIGPHSLTVFSVSSSEQTEQTETTGSASNKDMPQPDEGSSK